MALALVRGIFRGLYGQESQAVPHSGEKGGQESKLIGCDLMGDLNGDQRGQQQQSFIAGTPAFFHFHPPISLFYAGMG